MRNFECFDVLIRKSNNLHMPLANLTVYQQGLHYSGIKLFNFLPLEIKNIAGNPNKIKQALRKLFNTFILKACLYLEIKIILNCYNVY
jgi:hypothetical protein